MSGMKQHGQDMRQNHEQSVAHIAVAVGWLSKTAQTKQSIVELALHFSLGMHAILLLLVVAIFN